MHGLYSVTVMSDCFMQCTCMHVHVCQYVCYSLSGPERREVFVVGTVFYSECAIIGNNYHIHRTRKMKVYSCQHLLSYNTV